MSERSLFIRALEIDDPAQRAELLTRECGNDAELRHRIEKLLSVHSAAGGILDNPPSAVLPSPFGRGAGVEGGVAGEGADTDLFRPITEGPGAQIGPYKLREKIGEGGFGVVYVAEQEKPVRRKVALKIIKPGMDTKDVIARFEAERQALALMDHPNVARVLDAGATESGRPYFVMELVHGVPINEFCDKNNLPTRDRLLLFADVCRAVQHAHQKGIIHRDLKPSNIMVTLHDGKPVAKVIDFGVSKALSQQLTEKSIYTAYGQMIGTPSYMSPEQAEMSGLGIDTRSDIYSLGVLLYELLTGTTPLDSKRLRAGAYAEILRIIREEEPQRPSLKISTLGEQATIIAQQRHTNPTQLRRELAGELDWIVLKCLEKDRARRYETANNLARDVERYLNNEQVEACPPTTAYRLRKFLHKHRAGALTATMVALTMLIGTLASYWQAYRAAHAEQRAVIEAQLARQAREAEANERKRAEVNEQAARRSEQVAQQEKSSVIATKEELRKTLYATEMNLVRLESQRNNLTRMQELLFKQIPSTGEEDLRGFEWNYWYRYLNRAEVVLRASDIGFGNVPEPFTIAPEGNLVACTRGNSTIEFRELPSGKVVGTVPVAMTLGTNTTPLTSSGLVVDGSAISAVFDPPPTQFSKFKNGFQIWDLTGNKRSFSYPTGSLKHVNFLQISADSRVVAAVGLDPTHQRDRPVCRLLAWEVESGRLVLDATEPRELNRLAIAPDGSRLAAIVAHSSQRYSSDQRDIAVVYDISTQQRLSSLQHDDDADHAFFLPQGDRLLLTSLGFSGRYRKELLSWTIGDSSATRLSAEHMPDHVKGTVSHDGKLFAVSGNTISTIRVIDTTTGVVLSTLHHEASNINSVTFSADDKKIVACSTNGKVLTWDISQDDDLFRLRASPLRQLAYSRFKLSADQSLLAITTAQGGLRLRNRDGTETTLLPDIKTSGSVDSSVGFSSDNHLIFFRTPQAIRLLELPTGNLRWEHPISAQPAAVAANLPSFSGVRTYVNSVKEMFSSDSRHFVALNGDFADVMDIQTGQLACHYRLSVPGSFTGLVRHRETGQILLPVLSFREGAKSLRLLDAVNEQAIVESNLPTDLMPTELVVAPNARYVAVVDRLASRVEVWNLGEPRERAVVSASGSSVVFSADGQQLAVLNTQIETQRRATIIDNFERIKEVGLWDLAAGRQISTVTLAGNSADDVRFSPNGSRLLTFHGKLASGGGGRVPEGRMWDIASGRELMTIPVADVNHYTWELLFDSAGNRLMLYVLSKTSTTGGAWGALAFDGTPLSEADHTLLLARPRVDELFREHILSSRVIAAIDADSATIPTVRQAMMVVAKQRGDNADALDIPLQTMLRRGYRQLLADEIPQAMRLADALVELEPRTAKHYVSRGQVWCCKADFQRALADYDEAIRLEPNEANAYLHRGTVKRELGRLEDSLHDLNTGIKLNPKSPGAFHQRGLAREAKQQYDEAIADQSEGIRLLPGMPNLYFARGDAWRKKGNLDNAIQDYDQALALAPNFALVYGKRGEAYRQKGEFDKAIQDFDEGIRLDPSTATPFNNRAIVFLKLGDAQRAIRDCDEAIRRNPRAATPFNNRGYARKLLGEFDAAIKDLDESIRLRPSPNAYSHRGDVHRLQGKFEIALKGYDAALTLDPKFAAALAGKARLLATCNDETFRNGKLAVELATRACELNRWKDASIVAALAAAQAETANFAEAIKFEEQAISLLTAYEKPADYQSRLALYRENKPYREPPPSNPPSPNRP